MEILFKIEENIEEIVQEIKTGTHMFDWDEVNDRQGRLLDHYFLGSYAQVSLGDDADEIHIITDLSQFEYRIFRLGEETRVKYKGAYMGLLSQNLIPTMTPINLLKAEVHSSLAGICTLREYIVIRESFVSYKKQAGLQSNHYTHPRCITKLKKER